MAVSVVNLSLKAAGIVASVTDLAPFLRSITFYDQETGKQIFNGIPFFSSAHLNAGVDQSSKLCDSPVESGAKISDHKIRMPRTITCALVIPSFLGGLVVDQLNEYFRNSAKIMVQCPAGVFANMILESMPVNMTPENVSRPIYELRLREVLIVVPQLVGIEEANAANPSDADTKKQSVLSDFIKNNEIIGNALNAVSGWMK